ncbi:hypothetical protein ACWPKO_15100 [Coraliomargarita sp. W4R53]
MKRFRVTATLYPTVETASPVRYTERVVVSLFFEYAQAPSRQDDRRNEVLECNNADSLLCMIGEAALAGCPAGNHLKVA